MPPPKLVAVTRLRYFEKCHFLLKNKIMGTLKLTVGIPKFRKGEKMPCIDI